MPLTLAASVFSSPLHTIVFLVIAIGLGAVLWAPLALSRRFRTLKCASIIIGSVTGMLALIVSAAPSRRAPASAPVDSTVAARVPARAAAPTPAPAVPAKTTAPGKPAAAPSIPVIPGLELADPIVDDRNAFSIQFPRDWESSPIDGRPWILEATDAGRAFISVGVQPMAGEPRPIATTRAGVEGHLRKQPDTTFHSSGTDTIQGHAYAWFKYTGPMPMTTGSPRMTMVHYIIPLPSRAIEIRMAASPDQFTALQPLMNRSIESFLIRESRSADASDHR